jgi:hypothetical protein
LQAPLDDILSSLNFADDDPSDPVQNSSVNLDSTQVDQFLQQVNPPIPVNQSFHQWATFSIGHSINWPLSQSNQQLNFLPMRQTVPSLLFEGLSESVVYPLETLQTTKFIIIPTSSILPTPSKFKHNILNDRQLGNSINHLEFDLFFLAFVGTSFFRR